MGILLVYDVTDEASFNNVRNWMKNIETHASSTVNKVGAISLCNCYCVLVVGSWGGNKGVPLAMPQPHLRSLQYHGPAHSTP